MVLKIDIEVIHKLKIIRQRIVFALRACRSGFRFWLLFEKTLLVIAIVTETVRCCYIRYFKPGSSEANQLLFAIL